MPASPVSVSSPSSPSRMSSPEPPRMVSSPNQPLIRSGPPLAVEEVRCEPALDHVALVAAVEALEAGEGRLHRHAAARGCRPCRRAHRSIPRSRSVEGDSNGAYDSVSVPSPPIIVSVPPCAYIVSLPGPPSNLSRRRPSLSSTTSLPEPVRTISVAWSRGVALARLAVVLTADSNRDLEIRRAVAQVDRVGPAVSAQLVRARRVAQEQVVSSRCRPSVSSPGPSSSVSLPCSPCSVSLPSPPISLSAPFPVRCAPSAVAPEVVVPRVAA